MHSGLQPQPKQAVHKVAQTCFVAFIFSFSGFKIFRCTVKFELSCMLCPLQVQKRFVGYTSVEPLVFQSAPVLPSLLT